MRMLAVSDMHGNIENVMRALDEYPADLVVSCGDWGDPGELDGAALEEIASRAPIVSVYGNHDDTDVLSSVSNRDGSSILLRNGEVRRVRDLNIAGISGIWAKSHRKPYYVTDEDVEEIARGLTGRRVDILLTHGCPVGLADVVPGGRHGGQRCFLDAFKMVSPRLHLCGHLHAAQKKQLADGRLVVNIGHTLQGDYWTFDFVGGELTFEHRRLADDS